MQVLQWALSYPEQVPNAAIVAASSRLTAQNIAFSAVARRAIMDDPDFHGGRYAEVGVVPRLGLRTARMMAHITYLSEDAFSEKFGRNPHPERDKPGFGIDFAVESYLDYQGRVFLERFDALSYLYLSRVMDYFDPFSRPDATDGISALPVNFLVMSFDTDWRFSTEQSRRIVRHLERAALPVNFLVLSIDTDWRFSTEHSRRIVRHLERAAQPVTFRDIPSNWGHDSFLLPVDRYHDTLRGWFGRALREGR
jgi:homoserine O-acetyltransferase/O-succinyltransferase